MIEAINAAIAGLRVSAQRIGVAAENIANANSAGALAPYDGYVPQRLEQSTTSLGTPAAAVQPLSPAFVPLYAPGDSRADADGLIGYPNVDLAATIVDMTLAQRSYEANLATLRTASAMMKVLLDRTA